MKMLISLAFLLMFAVTISSEALAASYLNNVKRVGVISLIGDKMAVWGPLILEAPTKITQADVADWKIDDYIEQNIANVLRGHFDIEPVSGDRSALLAQEDKIFFSPNDLVQNLSSDADVYIIIYKSRPQNAGPVDQSTGLVLKRGKMWFAAASHPGITAYFSIAVFDAKTKKLLAKQPGHMPPFAALKVVFAPARAITEDEYSEDADALTGSQREKLKAGFEKMLPGAIAQTLFELGLAQTAPPPTALYVDCKRSDGTKYTIGLISTDSKCEKGDDMVTSSGRLDQ
jgi:hypothetical protein